MIQYIGHNKKATGTRVACLMADTFLLHFDDFRPNMKILKTRYKHNTKVFKL